MQVNKAERDPEYYEKLVEWSRKKGVSLSRFWFNVGDSNFYYISLGEALGLA